MKNTKISIELHVISRLTDIPWPAHSPDLALNDYYLWGVALRQIRRVKPVGMEGVKDLVSTYLCSLPPDEMRRATENLLVRCRGGLPRNEYSKLPSI